MPIYVYQVQDDQKGCEYCCDSFEVIQSFSDPLLDKCPKCGALVHRTIQNVGVVKQGKKHLLSDNNIKKHGFTKLVNEGGGKFRKI